MKNILYRSHKETFPGSSRISVRPMSIFLAVVCLIITAFPAGGEESKVSGNGSAFALSIQKICATDMQKTIAGQELEKPLQVKVTDGKGKPVNKAKVRFEVKKGDGRLVDPVTGLSVTEVVDTSDADGIAEAWFKTGPDTSANKTYLNLSGASATRVDLNIIDAWLDGEDRFVKSPFCAYGLPGPPARMEILPDETRQGDMLSPAGPVAVSALDANGNPVSNVNVHFTASVENADCVAPEADNKALKFIAPESACLITDFPASARSATKSEFSRMTDADGRALVYVILGGVPRADYLVTAGFKAKDGHMVTGTASFHTTDVVNWVCNNDYGPGGHLVVFELLEGDNPFCGSPGDRIDLRAYLQLIIEEEKKQVISCIDGRHCAHIYGIKRFTTAFNNNENIRVSFDAKVVFNHDPGKDVCKGSLHTYNYTIAPGIATVPVTYSATVIRDVTYTPCETCSITKFEQSYQGEKTFTVYGIDAGFVDGRDAAVSEVRVPVNEDRLTVTDTPLRVKVDPSGYIPDSCFVIIYKNNDIVSYIPVDIVKGRGTANLIRGYCSDETGIYTAGIVLNKGRGYHQEMETPEAERLQLIPVRAGLMEKTAPDAVKGEEYLLK